MSQNTKNGHIGLFLCQEINEKEEKREGKKESRSCVSQGSVVEFPTRPIHSLSYRDDCFKTF